MSLEPEKKEFDKLNMNDFKAGTKTLGRLNMMRNALGDNWHIPLMIAKGKNDGPILGITAAMHGNELNGIPIIQELWKKIDVTELNGTLICVPVMNAPGFIRGEREFHTGKDLNRIMPGKEHGTTTEVYAEKLFSNIITPLEYLIDLHTASFGRINSLYVRANLTREKAAEMARLQEPQIIVNKPGQEGTLRGEAAKLGVNAITVEVGDSHVFQRKHIRPSIFGLNNVLVHLGMIDEEMEDIEHDPILCKSSEWLYADTAGILRVKPGLVDQVEEGELIATISNIYGEVIDKMKSPYDAVVVAKATNPVCQVGSRVIHLGVLK